MGDRIYWYWIGYTQQERGGATPPALPPTLSPRFRRLAAKPLDLNEAGAKMGAALEAVGKKSITSY